LADSNRKSLISKDLKHYQKSIEFAISSLKLFPLNWCAWLLLGQSFSQSKFPDFLTLQSIVPSHFVSKFFFLHLYVEYSFDMPLAVPLFEGVSNDFPNSIAIRNLEALLAYALKGASFLNGRFRSVGFAV
jgi:hypothetical protein